MTRRAAARFAALGALLVALGLPGIAQAALYPANDDFLRQQELHVAERGGSPLATATSEAGEPAHGATGPVRSAWWSWTPTHSGLAEVQSCASTFTPLLGLYTGFDVAQLTPVATTPMSARCQPPGSYPYGSARRFQAERGTTYRIATATDAPGDGSADVTVQTQPVGDDFADATVWPADVEEQTLALGLATAQAGEPAHGGRPTLHSAWYVHTPTRRERVRLDPCDASTATIYRGSSLAGLTEIASGRGAPGCGYGQVEAVLDAGVEYRFAITAEDPVAVAVRVRLTRSPRDDSAASPSKLAMYSSGWTVDLGMATAEPGEPAHAGQTGGRSRWRVLTPERSTTYEISTCPAPNPPDKPPADALLAVYEGGPGTPVDALTPITSNDDGCASGKGSLVRFRALGGHRYLVAVDSKGGAAGTVPVNVSRSPAADDRASAAAEHRDWAERYPSFSTALATAQPGEPAHAGSPAAHSVWYRWVAPRTGDAHIALCGASFDAVLAVYGVDPAQPALAAAGATPGCNDLGWGTTGTGPRVDLAVTAGRTYLIAVDGRNGATGTTGRLTTLMRAPLNDDLADASSLGGPNDSDLLTMSAKATATAQPGEPAHAGRAPEHTSWWRWTATRTGFVMLSACSPSPSPGDDSTLAVYTGDVMSSLRPVAAADEGCGSAGGPGDAKLTFYAVEGTIYRVAVDVHGSTTGAAVDMWLPPANDRFDRARAMPATGVSSGNLSGAGREPGEPDHAGRGGGRSLWFAWTAARTEFVEMYTCGSVDTLLGVYTGAAVDALQEVASNDDGSSSSCDRTASSRVRFRAEAGTSYRIAVDGKNGASGPVNITIRTPVDADRFATAAQLSPRLAQSAVTDLSLTGAEPGEPAHAGHAAERSSWLRFTPTHTYVVEARSCSSVSDRRLAAYTGAELATLTPVAADDDDAGACAGARGARIRFEALAGVTYSLAVDASIAESAQVSFRLLPANDDLAAAADLTLTPATAVVDTLSGATREAGEPEHGAGTTAVSAWYRVRVATARTVHLSVCPASRSDASSARLAAYTGGSPATLQPLAGATGADCYRSAGGRIAFAAQPGTDVLIAVAAPAGRAYAYELRVEDVPANDLFAAATVVGDRGGGSGSVRAANAGREPGEPRHAGAAGGQSLWWRYTPTSDRVVQAHGCTEDSDPLLAVYTGGAVDALTPVAMGIQTQNGPGGCADLSFDARAGVTYHVAIDSESDRLGVASLVLTPRLPDHATFSAATPIAIPSARIGETLRPGPELGEPVHAGLGASGSVWYRLDPVQDEVLDINSCGFNGADTVVAVYTGTAVDDLTEVAANDDDERAQCSFGNRDAHVTVRVRAGTVYWVAVDDAAGAPRGSFGLLVAQRAPHDAFSDPIELVPGVPVSAAMGNATAEPGEPAHDAARPAHSVWAAWTADRSGRVVIDSCDTPWAGLTLAAYTGDSVDALTPVASNDDSPACLGSFGMGARLELDAVAGQRYHVAVDEPLDYSAAQVTLHVAPPNDERAHAAELPVPGAGADVDLTAAGTEAGEPPHAGVRGGGSAWYRIAPAVSADLEVDTCATKSFDSVLAVYRLGVGDVLVPVAEGDDAARCGSGWKGARMRWHAEAGRTYLVAVAGATAQRGPAHLDVRTVVLPAPDTRLTSAVARRTAATTVSVAFDSDAPGASFECRADQATEWSPCVSPVVRSGLDEGDHLVAVRALAGGVADPSAEVAAFTVDRNAPKPSLAQPTAGAIVGPGDVTYSGTCGERTGDRGELTVRIWRGDDPSGTPLMSELTPCDPDFEWYTRLAEGKYTITVAQADDVGNSAETPPRQFTVQAPTPGEPPPPPPTAPAAPMSPPAPAAPAPRTSPLAPASRAKPPASPSAADAAAIADGLLPGRGTVSVSAADTLGNGLFLVPGRMVRLRAAASHVVGAAVCPRRCRLQIQAAIKLRGQIKERTRHLTVVAGATGTTLRIRIDASLRRRIQRARRATATLTIRYVDAAGGAHRVTAKVTLLARGG